MKLPLLTAWFSADMSGRIRIIIVPRFSETGVVGVLQKPRNGTRLRVCTPAPPASDPEAESAGCKRGIAP